ncbi:calcium-binding protein 1-like [Passer montanus]|uniref:calcium-binding protein 1-like n=1 Tax=Passer montanus TaxID=9160 RepID=UPI00195F4957|nr:calcium-binding protein 1-like [Passer montanus]
MKTRENTIPKKHLVIGGKLAAQTLPPLYPDIAQETIGRTGETPGKDRAAKTSIFHQLGWKPKSLADKEGCDATAAAAHRRHHEPPSLSGGQRGLGEALSRPREAKGTAAEQKILKAWKGKVEGRAGGSRAREAAQGRGRLRLQPRLPGTPPPVGSLQVDPLTPAGSSGPGSPVQRPLPSQRGAGQGRRGSPQSHPRHRSGLPLAPGRVSAGPAGPAGGGASPSPALPAPPRRSRRRAAS